ncbi:MAG: CDP-diacylglycerol--glycerol-3-phosphate 3-phosphatidyltransferase [Ignavibacteriae bacterium]|nr:CDP-diacylglycerol--glycerol-3-phosphate 3-phosphatidyltransferase [Ignavibacteriota bacterium]
MNYSLPNLISFLRVLLAPLFFVLICSHDEGTVRIAVIVFILGSLTDYFDGWLARRRKEVSTFGAFFDPLADKVFTSTAFVALAVIGIFPFWMVLIVIARDIGTTLLRVYGDSLNRSIITSRNAKVKTFLQMAFIVYVLLLIWFKYLEGLPFVQETASWLLASSITYFMMLALTIHTVWTSIDYLLNNGYLVRYFWKNDAANFLRIAFVSILGVGFLPMMPGTFGSLAALLILLAPVNYFAILICAVVATIIGVLVIGNVEKRHGSDPHCVVIDEAIGMWLILALPTIPHTLFWISIGFVLFRLFDIWKPFPIGWLNNHSGALWVIADDVLAAFYSIIVMLLLQFAIMVSPIVIPYIQHLL